MRVVVLLDAEDDSRKSDGLFQDLSQVGNSRAGDFSDVNDAPYGSHVDAGVEDDRRKVVPLYILHALLQPDGQRALEARRQEARTSGFSQALPESLQFRSAFRFRGPQDGSLVLGAQALQGRGSANVWWVNVLQNLETEIVNIKFPT